MPPMNAPVGGRPSRAKYTQMRSRFGSTAVGEAVMRGELAAEGIAGDAMAGTSRVSRRGVNQAPAATASTIAAAAVASRGELKKRRRGGGAGTRDRSHR